MLTVMISLLSRIAYLLEYYLSPLPIDEEMFM